MSSSTWVVFALAIISLIVSIHADNSSPIIELPPWLHLDGVNSYIKDIVDNIESSDCARPCIEDEPRICYRKLNIENYQAMGAACGNCSRGVQSDCLLPQCVPTDGFEKGIISINRQIPGPLIDVCWKDLLVIDVINRMHSETFSIHWHGQLQTKTPYMDGVPYTTQCPIMPLNTFRYTFFAEDHGTFFYHSHSGLQRYNGAYGGLVVRLPETQNRLIEHYDEDLHDHVMVISDWSHESVEMFFVGLPTRQPGLLPQAVLIHGKGRFYLNETNVQAETPYKTLYVEHGKKYRIRVVNAGSTVCPVQLQIQDHRMTIISTDADDVEPHTVDSFMIHTGERYDFILDASQEEGLYWIQARLKGVCTNSSITQTAVLSYLPDIEKDGILPPSAYKIEEYPRGVYLADQEISTCHEDPDNMCVSELETLRPPHFWLSEPDQRFYFNVLVQRLNTSAFFDMGKYNPFFNIRGNQIFLGTVNGISHRVPRYNLLSQGKQIDTNEFCDKNNRPDHCDTWDGCICTHVIYLEKNSLVEFVIFDGSRDSGFVAHPMHLHGVQFVVMAQKRVPGQQLTVELIEEMEKNGELELAHTTPVVKDTIAIQNQGLAVIRFIADNPGAWLVHCHIEDHMTFGMQFIMMIEGVLPPKPEDFPVCGPFPSMELDEPMELDELDMELDELDMKLDELDMDEQYE